MKNKDTQMLEEAYTAISESNLRSSLGHQAFVARYENIIKELHNKKISYSEAMAKQSNLLMEIIKWMKASSQKPIESVEEAYEQVASPSKAFRSPEEVFKTLTGGGSSPAGTLKIRTALGKQVVGQYKWNPETKHLSIHWQEQGEEYGVDFDPKDLPRSSYPYQEDESSYTIEWAPGEKFQVLK